MKHRVIEHRLDNGASGLVIDVPGSAVVSLRVTFHSGYQFVNGATYEVPHIMEHLLATVTKRRSQPNAFMIEAQKNGAYVNASTSADANEYVYECAEFELERIIDLVEEQICEPLFAREPFEAERSNVREELTRNTTSHMAVCSMALLERAFPKQWKNYEDRIGQLDSIKLEQLEAHYAHTHTSANARFYVAGSFGDGGQAVAARFEKIFARLPRGNRLALSRVVGERVDAPIVIHRDIEQVYYRAGRYFGDLSERERAALALLRMLMVGGMGSRVLGEARRRGLAYSVGVASHSEPGSGSFGFTGYVTPAHAAALFEVASRGLHGIAAGECTSEELVAAQDLLVGSIARSTQTAGDLLSWYLDRYDDESQIRSFDEELVKLRDVSVREVGEMARTVLAGSGGGVSMLGRFTDEEAARYAAALHTIA